MFSIFRILTPSDSKYKNSKSAKVRIFKTSLKLEFLSDTWTQKQFGVQYTKEIYNTESSQHKIQNLSACVKDQGNHHFFEDCICNSKIILLEINSARNEIFPFVNIINMHR